MRYAMHPSLRRFQIVFWASAICAALLASLVIACVLLLFASPMESVRRSLVEGALQSQLNKDVILPGPIEVSLLKGVRLRTRELIVRNPGQEIQSELLRLRSVDVGFRLWPMLFGSLSFTHIAFESGELNVEIGSNGRANWSDQDRSHSDADFSFTDMLHRIAPIGSVTFKNFSIRRSDASTGFDAKIHFNSFETQRDQERRTIAVVGSGTINEESFVLSGRMPIDHDIRIDDPAQATLAMRAKSFSVLLEARAGREDRQPTQYLLEVRTPSIRAFLGMLNIARNFDGIGNASARLLVADGDISIQQMTARLQTNYGDVITASGSIERLVARSGIELDFSASISPQRNEEPTVERPSMSRFEFTNTKRAAQKAARDAGPLERVRLVGLSGRISGNLDALHVNVLRVRTNMLDPDLREIGPISIQKFRRDRDGRLQLLGIQVVAGSKRQPKFRLQGDIRDLLRLREVMLSGNFAVRTNSLLGVAATRASSDLGTLKGMFQITDVNGSLGVKKLDARTENSRVFGLQLSSATGSANSAGNARYNVSLSVPRYRDLAIALGAAPLDIGKIEFQGHAEGGNDELRLTGNARVGATEFSTQLTGRIENNKPSLNGEIHAKTIRLSDFRAILLLDSRQFNRTASDNGNRVDETGHVRRETAGNAWRAQVNVDQAPFKSGRSRAESTEAPKINYDDLRKLLNGFNLDLRTKADRIVGRSKEPSRHVGHIRLRNGVLSMNPFRIHYLGGQVEIRGSIDAKKQTTHANLNVRTDDWPLGQVLEEFGASVPVSGELYTDIALSASGNTFGDMIGSLVGHADIAVSRGRIESSLVALSGLDLSDYLFSHAAQKGYTKVNCFVGRFKIAKGIASTPFLLLDTPDIQMLGRGSINLSSSNTKIYVEPRPKKRKIIELGTPFSIEGALSNLRIVNHGTAQRAIAEVALSWNINLLGSLVGLIADSGNDRSNPCLGKGR